jgi:hypothetical protein
MICEPYLLVVEFSRGCRAEDALRVDQGGLVEERALQRVRHLARKASSSAGPVGRLVPVDLCHALVHARTDLRGSRYARRTCRPCSCPGGSPSLYRTHDTEGRLLRAATSCPVSVLPMLPDHALEEAVALLQRFDHGQHDAVLGSLRDIHQREVGGGQGSRCHCSPLLSLPSHHRLEHGGRVVVPFLEVRFRRIFIRFYIRLTLVSAAIRRASGCVLAVLLGE